MGLKKLLSILLISCLGLLVYSNTFFCSFHFDDEMFVVRNVAIRNLHHWQGIWQYFHGRFITFLTFALNYHFNGLNVLGYHVINLTVHILAAVLVWWLVRLTLATPVMKDDQINRHADTIALLTGLIFVVHPVQTEAVTYIWQRTASMVALFYLVSLCLYVESRLTQSRICYGGALVLAVMAMFTKENSVTLPLMVLVYEFTFLKTGKIFEWKMLTPFLLTVLIVPVTFLFIKSQAFGQMHGDLRTPGGVLTPNHYFVTQFRAMFTYIRLCFFPFHQSLDYDYPVFKNIFELPVLASLVGLMGIGYAAIRLFPKYRLLSFTCFWFFLTLAVPESSFWVMGDLVAEHRLYLPLAGFSIFLVSGAYYCWGKNNIKAMTVVLSLVIACYGILTYQRNMVWRNEFTLWDDAARKFPQKARPYVNRGLFYENQKNYTQAFADFTKAIELDPNNPVVYFDLGLVQELEGNYNPALIEYTKSLIVDPTYFESYLNRGAIYVKLGKPQLALNDYKKAIEINPKFGQAYYNRYIIYFRLKEYGKAWADVHRLQELGFAVDPKFIDMLKKHQDK